VTSANVGRLTTAKSFAFHRRHGDPFGLHRPGWRIASGGSERDLLIRDSQRKAIEDAHAEYLDRLTNAWKSTRSADAGRRRSAVTTIYRGLRLFEARKTASC
jgi:hypothetical protein